MQGLKDDELGIQMPGEGDQAGKIIDFTIEMVFKMYLGHLSYDMVELGDRYEWGQGCVLKSMPRSPQTVREWFTEVTDVDFDECCETWPQLPVALTHRGLFEIGILFDRADGEQGQERRTWAAPRDYWHFTEKVRYYMDRGFKPPSSWTNISQDGIPLPPNAMV